jgi:hypothetical protein
MRKLAVGLIALILGSVIASPTAQAGQQMFFHRPVFFHQSAFFHQPAFFHHPDFFRRRVFFHRPFFNFAFVGFPVGFAVPYGYSYYPPYAYPPYAYPDYAPTTFPQQAPGPAPAQSWYYCDAPKGFYPYVQSCGSGWRQVPTVPPMAQTAPPP